MKKILLILLSTFSWQLLAGEFDKAKMDAFFKLLDDKQQSMGTVSLFQNGKEVYQNTIGYVDIEADIKSNNSTTYRIGSISKTFTAVLIMQLIEAGQLKLNDTLDSYYPQVKNSESITIEHLLRHRSGLFNFTQLEDYTSWMSKPLTEAEMLNKIVAFNSEFEPGTAMQYSNTNYILLSFIIEKIRNKPFPEILQTHINKTCSLMNTYYGGKISSEKNEAFSYSKLDAWKLSPETDMSIPQGAGALVSNATDLNKFFDCLFSEKLLSKESLEKMMDMQDGYGLGLFKIPFYGKSAYGHNGGIDAFQSNAYYFPEEKLSFAYISNGTVMSLNDIAIAVLSIYIGEQYTFPDFIPPLKLSDEQLNQFIGTYSTPGFPLKMTITNVEGHLYGQATGQDSFRLDAFAEDKFKYDAAGIVLEFNAENKTMKLIQGGNEFNLTLE